MSRRSLSRRTVLATALAVGASGVAGCVDTGTDTDEPTDDDRSPPEYGQDDDDRRTDEQVHAGYETTEVRIESDGEILGTVTAAIADTPDKRYTGLSDTESLPEDRGMLFIMPEPDNYSFVMREMDFGIDIVYADSDGTITEIHHAPEPGPDEDGNQQRYPGYGQYVLEVGYRWTENRGIEVGDLLVF